MEFWILCLKSRQNERCSALFSEFFHDFFLVNENSSKRHLVFKTVMKLILKLNITYLCEIVITVINEFLQVSVVKKLIFLLAGLHVFAKVGLLNVLDIGPRRGQKWGKGFKVIVFYGFVDFSNDGQKLTKLKTKISKKF